MKKMTDQDLTEESIKFATHYIKETQQEGLNVTELSKITTTAAQSFFSGVRWHEEQLKIRVILEDEEAT
jgi:hypothetical protein